MNTYCKYVTKITFVGDSCIGKTAICDYLTNNIHNKYYEKTVGVNYITYNTTSNHTLCIWDTTGDKEFIPFTKQYFNGTDVICIFFKASYVDVSKTGVRDTSNVYNSPCFQQNDSYESIDEWHDIIINNTTILPVIFIININYNNYYTNYNDIRIKAASMGAFYYELNMSNIYELFDIISLSFNNISCVSRTISG